MAGKYNAKMKISSHYSWTVPMRRYCETHDTYIWTKNQAPKNTSFKVNCTFVTTSLIFPQAYKSMHTLAHTLALPCVLSKTSGGSRCLQHVPIIMA